MPTRRCEDSSDYCACIDTIPARLSLNPWVLSEGAAWRLLNNFPHRTETSKQILVENNLPPVNPTDTNLIWPERKHLLHYRHHEQAAQLCSLSNDRLLLIINNLNYEPPTAFGWDVWKMLWLCLVYLGLAGATVSWRMYTWQTFSRLCTWCRILDLTLYKTTTLTLGICFLYCLGLKGSDVGSNISGALNFTTVAIGQWI